MILRMMNKKSHKKLHKKSQTEAVGLAIVVILIILIISFVIGAIFFKEKEDPLESFIQKELSSSIIDAMLRTDSYCTKDTTVRDLFQYFVRTGGADNDGILCSNEAISQANFVNVGQSYDEQSYDECTFIPDSLLGNNKVYSNNLLKCIISVMLGETLGEWNKPYHFMIKYDGLSDNGKFELKSTPEPGKSLMGEVTPYTLPVSSGAGGYMEIWLCIGGECPIMV